MLFVVVPTTLVALLCFSFAVAAEAQTVQVAPFGGYRFGGDLYEEITATSLDIDGAPSVGALVDVFLDPDLSVTFSYSHQDARVDLPRPGGAPQRVALSIDHWHAGGTQEFGRGVVQPFLVGTLGLTRYGGGGDSEVRFSMAAGGGVKVMPSRHFGLRLDGRVVCRVRGWRRRFGDLRPERVRPRVRPLRGLAGGVHRGTRRLVLTAAGRPGRRLPLRYSGGPTAKCADVAALSDCCAASRQRKSSRFAKWHATC